MAADGHEMCYHLHATIKNLIAIVFDFENFKAPTTVQFDRSHFQPYNFTLFNKVKTIKVFMKIN
jgi:hypothetical protein